MSKIVEDRIAKIRKKLPVTEMLAGLAEETSELAQAALKLRRVWDKTNPTPVKEERALDDLYEEIADVYLYVEALGIPLELITEIMDSKLNRWIKRMEGKE